MGVTFTGGLANVTSPGVYTISAKSGSITASATLTATYNGDQFDPGFNQGNANKTVLDGAPGGATQIMYPVDKSLFPANLTPIYAQMMASGANSIAAPQLPGDRPQRELLRQLHGGRRHQRRRSAPGGGCYVKLPLSLTQLFIATSEKEDIKMTARVSNGGAPVESQTINVAWANVGLSGGLYYWSVVLGRQTSVRRRHSDAGDVHPARPAAHGRAGSAAAAPRSTATTSAPARRRRRITWTDDGGPKGTSPYSGAPQAIVNGAGGRALHRLPRHLQRRQVHGADPRRLVGRWTARTSRCSTSPCSS